MYTTGKCRDIPNEVKAKIYKLLKEIDDEVALNYLMEEAAFYASKKDIVDNLDKQQLEELDKAISEAENGDTISLDDFKKEMDEWRKK
ncbi:MAG: hypothetical protein ACTHMM_26160 [Agriterribacter sp.]